MLSFNKYLKNFSYPVGQLHAFFLIKPDFLSTKEEIYDLIIKNKKLDVVGFSPIKLNKISASELYKDHKTEDFFDSLIKYMTSDLCYLVEINLKNEASNLSYSNKIKAQRIFNDELKEIIRNEFGKNDMKNVVHSPDVNLKEIVRQNTLLRANIAIM